MSLYDDVLPDDEIKTEKESNKTKAWSNSSMNLLQHHLQNRKQQQQKPNQFKPRQTIYKSTKPTVPLMTSQQTFTARKYTGSLLGGEWNVSLEYDPFWPNDYEKIMKEKKAANQAQITIKPTTFTPPTPVLTLGSRPLVDAYSDDEDDEDESKKPKGVSIAPPPSLIESTDTSPPATTQSLTNFNNVPPQSTTALNMNVSDVAAKIMARMGYKEGQGLGKNQQGIATALQVEKTSKNSGVIISNSNLVTTVNKEEFTMLHPPAQQSQIDEQPQESITEIMKNPTKVIMLRNMVGQGEVDAELEPEVREECSKFGEVNSCLIYEVNEGLVNGKQFSNLKKTGQAVTDENAVRIFVEFLRVESAIKALIDLNGRYFGGRVVKGQFYDVDKFKKMDLFK